jgi:FtsZ-interacting cell division protein ZipA
MNFYFAPVFKYIFLYVLICLLLIAGFWTNMVGGNWLSRRRRGRSRTTDEADQQQAAQQDDLVQQQAAPQVDDDQQQDNDDQEQDASGSGASRSRGIYLRGPTSLPQRPILRDRRPLIRPEGDRYVTLCSSFLFIICVQNHNIN